MGFEAVEFDMDANDILEELAYENEAALYLVIYISNLIRIWISARI